MQAKIIEISTHKRYNPIVDESVLVIYNTYNKVKNLDSYQLFQFRSAIDALRIANDRS